MKFKSRYNSSVEMWVVILSAQLILLYGAIFFTLLFLIFGANPVKIYLLLPWQVYAVIGGILAAHRKFLSERGLIPEENQGV